VKVSRNHLSADDHFGALKARIADNCADAILARLPMKGDSNG
jgi:hypothetical protein